jgi:histidinol-phosphate aminotransferase
MDPSFTVYSEIAVAEGRKSVFIPLNYPFDLALDDILSVLTDKTRLIFLTRPNNPTSRLIPLALLGSVLKMVKNAIIVADEAYIEFADNYRKQTAANLINQTGNLIVTRTFSKAYGIPNLRIGYALGPADAIDYLFKIKPKWNVGEVAQQAAIGALKDQEHFRNVLEVVSEGREFLCKQLDSHPKLQVVPDPQGNFIMVNVSDTGYSSEAFADLLGTKGILIRGDFHPHYVRISIGTHFENLALIEAIKEVLD